MKVSVIMNQAALRTLSKAQAQALSMTAQQMLNETINDGVIPMDTGNMQNESTYVDDSKAKAGTVSIVTDAPYARRLYFHPEYNFRTDKNANARGEWFEEWLSGAKQQRPHKLYAAMFKRVTGGYVK
jgi:hypothetical protein